MTQTSFALTNRHGDVIRGNVHVPDAAVNAPVLVIVHGFKGFKDWGAFPAIADDFARNGIVTVRFNFSLNGIGDDDTVFTELEKFRRNTYTRECEDLADVIDRLVEGDLLPAAADRSHIALLGHSRGGGIALLHASRDRRVRAVAAWASVSTFDRWGPQLKAQWRERGLLEVMNQRTKQKMPLGLELLEDFERNHDTLDVPRAVSRLTIPLLIVHGEQDVSVPVEEAHVLRDAADPASTTLHIIPAADHVFGAQHPYAGMPDLMQQAIDRTRDWLRSALR